MRLAVFLDRDDTLIANASVTAHTPHPGDLVDPDLVQLLPGVAEGLALVQRAGYLLVVVTNQGCIARGVCPVERVHACNTRLRELLAAAPAANVSPLIQAPDGSRATDRGFERSVHRDHRGAQSTDRAEPRSVAQDSLTGRITPAPPISPVTLDAIYVCPYHPRGSVPPYNIEHPWRKPAPGMILAARDDLDIDLARSWMIGDAQRDLNAAIAAGIAPERTVLVSERTSFLQACGVIAEAAATDPSS